MNLVIDSGSTVTIISSKIYDKMHLNDKPPLTKISEQILLADGRSLQVLGLCFLKIVLGHLEVEHEVVVADVEAEGLLGIDFMTKYQCILNFKKGVLEVDGMAIPFRDESDSMCVCQVKVANNITISPGEELIVPGKLVQRCKQSSCGIVEASENFVANHSILVGRSLVNPSNRLVPVRMMNLGSEPKTLYQDTVVGTFHPVVDIDTEPTSQTEESCNQVKLNLPAYLEELYERSSQHLSKSEQQKLKIFLIEFQNVFAKGDDDLGKTGLVKHSIDTGNGKPIRQPIRRLPIHQRAEEEKQVKEMLKKGVVERSNSPWSSPIVLVKKKDGSTRCCVDYRMLNKITVKDAYPLPRTDDCFDALFGAKWFSTLDLCSGYWQVEMEPKDKEKTAFITRSGLYHFNVLPFGLCNAPATFERLMELVMSGLQWKVCLIYLDDIIVYGNSFDQQLERLKEVFQRLKKANLKLKVKKCELFQKSVAFLGHIVSEDGISADPSKVEAVKNWSVPQNLTELRSFLGLCSYYRKFIKGFAGIAAPLHKLTEKGKRFQWNELCEDAFNTLKNALISSPILAYPDESLSFILDTDACDTGIGAVLSQVQDGSEKVIAYASRRLNKAERQYCVTRRELLAIVHFVKQFKHYLYGRKFLIRTDHGSLRWLMNFKSPEGQLARWLEVLNSYSFDIQHRPGKQHGNADALSRIPCKQCGRVDGEDLMNEDQVIGKVQEVRVAEVEDVVNVTTSVMEGAIGEDEENQVLGISEVKEKSLNLQVDGGLERKELKTNAVQKVKKKVQMSSEEASWLEGWTNEELKERQSEDPNIAKLLAWKEHGQSRPTWEEISSENKYVKSLWSQWERLHIFQGIMYRRWESCDGLHVRWQLVLPRQMREEVLTYLHNAATAGHLGISRTLASVRYRFYWPCYQSDIVNWIKQCDHCASRKPSKQQNKSTLKQYIVGEPMERIAIDILGPLPKSSKGNKYIMVVVDYFTKWAEAYAIPDQEARTVADKLVQEFITRFGCPRQIHTDQGRNFESKLFKGMCDLLDVDKTRTTPFHPQSDGLVERLNRTLENMLSLYVADNQLDWDQYLSCMMMAYRATPQGSSQCSPNMLMLGRETELPVDLMIGKPPCSEEVTSKVEYVCKLREKLEDAHEYARYQLLQSARRQKKSYDHRVDENSLEVGEFVWLHNPNKKKGLSPKLQRRWVGPFLIVSKLGDCVYRIQKSQRTNPKVVHRNRITKYHGKEAHSWLENSDSNSVYTQLSEEASVVPPDDQHGNSVLPTNEDPVCLEKEDSSNVSKENMSDCVEECEKEDVLSDVESVKFGKEQALEKSAMNNTQGTNQSITSKTGRRLKPPKRYGEWIV